MSYKIVTRYENYSHVDDYDEYRKTSKLKSENIVYVTPNSRGLISDCYPITTQTIIKRKDEEK